MKRIVALMLVLVMALSVSLTAFAADAITYTVPKVWVDAAGETLEAGAYPDVAITFEIVSKSCDKNSFADYDTAENIPDITVAKAEGTSDIVISGVEAIEGVGHFYYTVKEENIDVAGVTTNTTEYFIEILITYVENDQVAGDYTTDREYECAISVAPGSTTKTDKIENVYTVGDLTIDKTVTGNLSNKDDSFKVDVTFASELPVLTDIVMPDQTVVAASEFTANNNYTVTKTIELSDNDGELTISNIPTGVKVTVAEQDCKPYTLVGYEVGSAASVTEAPVITIDDDGETVVITNEYKTEINTGVSLDSLPYILILAVVAGAAVVFFVKKRQNALELD